MKVTCLICNKQRKPRNKWEASLLLCKYHTYACPKCIKQHGEWGVQRRLMAIMRDKCACSIN